MTRVLLYTGVANRLALLYKLLQTKLLPRKMTTLIYLDEEEYPRVDDYLWTAKDDEFLPHCDLHNAHRGRTPVLLTTHPPPDDFSAEVLVSWREEPPQFMGRFAHLVDIVDNAHVEAGRRRYRHYQSHGHPLEIHPMRAGK